MDFTNFAGFQPLDWLFLAIILISGLLGLFRGFTREALSIITWIGSGAIAYNFSSMLFHIQPFSRWLYDYVPDASLRAPVAFLGLFIAALIAGSILSMLFAGLVSLTGLGGTDKLAGMLFGFGRGVIFLALIVMAVELTPIMNEPWWNSSILLPHIEVASNWLNHHVTALVDVIT